MLCLAISAISAASACSGGGGSKSTPTTTVAAGLTDDQAAAMANVLFNDYDAKGATFTAVAASTVTDERIELSGEIDWTTHTGHAVVTAKGTEAGVTEVFWQGAQVLERSPKFTGLLVTLGRPAAEFVARPGDPAGRPLDRVLAIVTGLASTERDNPLLLRQAPGSRFLRVDSLRGTAAQVLRYGERNVYWLADDDSRLLRFEGNNPTGNQPVIVDITALGPQTVQGPLTDQVVAVESVKDIYEASRAG